MTHKSTTRIKSAIRKARFDKAELTALLRFLMVLVQSSRGKSRLTKAQRKSLAITERQLGVRLSSGKGKGRRGRSKAKGHRGRKLTVGVHMVRVGKAMRKVRVLASGKWQFMKMKG